MLFGELGELSVAGHAGYCWVLLFVAGRCYVNTGAKSRKVFIVPPPRHCTPTCSPSVPPNWQARQTEEN